MIITPRATKHNYTSEILIDKDNNTVKKIIDYEPYSKELYDRELFWLIKLKYTNIVPTLIKYDPNELSITMEYCGEILCNDNKPNDVYEQLFNINKVLLENHCYYNDWKWGNFLVKNGRIFIIDFGWCPLIKEDYTCNSHVDTSLKSKPAGNYFQNIFRSEEDVSKVKLLDLNNDWQQVRPTCEENGDSCVVTGYQNYILSPSGIKPTSNNTILKHRILQKTIESDVGGKTVSDVGCANMYFGFCSHFLGASKVTGVDLDSDYILQNRSLIDKYKLENVSIKALNAADYKDKSDTVFAFAIIHWVYSCSGFLGSLDAVVEHFRSITNECLYIEWVDPTDDCIKDMLHHLSFNDEHTKKDYNKANFLKYLEKHFKEVRFLGNSKITREIYRCLV